MVSVSVLKKIGIKKSIGIGFENFWYRKKFRYWFRKNLVSKKVSVLVSEKFWYRKKYRYWYRKKLVSEKSIGIGFVQILGFLTHCPTQAPTTINDSPTWRTPPWQPSRQPGWTQRRGYERDPGIIQQHLQTGLMLNMVAVWKPPF